MKKLLLIIACTIQCAWSQNQLVGEYVSTTKNSDGIKLVFAEDNMYQISVFSGKYKIENDSIILNNENNENAFHILFEKGKKASNKLTIQVNPNSYYALFSAEYLGIQKTENGEVEYKLLKEYFNEQDLEEYSESAYKMIESVTENGENKSENSEPKLSFQIDRAYALHFVKYKDTKSKIEKYIIPNDVNVVDVTISDNYLTDLELSGKIEKDKSVIFLTDGRNPLRFIKKSDLKKPEYVLPNTKIAEKKWSYPGMKSRESYYDSDYTDSTAVVTDSVYSYSDSRYEFKANVEKNLKEALAHIQKDTTKYLITYVNFNDKKAASAFTDFINNYNENVSYEMYDSYNSEYDTYNFYLATKSDEAFFKKNNIKEKTILIMNKEGKIIASSTKSLDDISSVLNYDKRSILNKLKETENAIHLSNSILDKKTSIPELAKSLNTNYINFYQTSYYYAYTSAVDTAVAVADYPQQIENKESEDEAARAVEVVAADYDYDNNDFTYYKSEVSEKILAEKLRTIFEYYNSKNLINEDLINILLGEISGNHTTFDLFKNENNNANKQEIEYINYILKYNKEEDIKNKIAKIINEIRSNKSNNPDTATYDAIAYNLIAYSGYDLSILSSVIYSYNAKEQGSEEANKLVDLYYNILVNDKPLFENLDAQYSKSNTSMDDRTDWISFKNQLNSMLNAQAWDIFELNKSKDFERAIKWSELSNKIEKNNPYSLDTLAQLYYVVGKKAEAIQVQTQAVAAAKAKGIDSEEYEVSLKKMKN